MRRRDFLHYAVGWGMVSPALAWGSGKQAAQPAAGRKTKPDVVLYDGRYPGWPWITKTRAGSLLCVFREGTVHGYSANGKAMLTKSDDGGRTWSPATVIVDAPEVDDRNVAIAELPNREWLVAYNTYDAAGESLAMTVRSADGGVNWGSPRSVGTPNTRTRAAAVVLANGELLLPYYIAPGSGALAARSRDNGETWTTVRVPDTDGFIGDEWDALEVEPSRLIGMFRNSHPSSDGTFWKSESRDGGRSWSIPVRTNVRSLRFTSPPQIAWQDKAPTVIYADRRMVSVSAVTTSDPNYVQWDLNRRLACYAYNADESPLDDASYPVSVQIGPRQRLIVDYEIRSESRRITGYFVTFPDDWATAGRSAGP